MTDRVQREATPKRRRARAPRAEAGARLGPDVRAVIERAALVADGVGLLYRAPLECAAVLLRVEARALDRARAAFGDPLARAEADDVLARAARSSVPASVPGPAGGGPRRAEDLLEAAERRPGGRAILLSAAAECAAVAFGVHPDLVVAARALAARRGTLPDAVPEP